MRWGPLVLTLNAACSFRPGQAPPTTPDAPVDSAPSPPASRVWVVGEWSQDGRTIAGAFEDGALLPFGNGRPSPIAVPSGSSSLPSSTGYAKTIFDVAADGKSTAFIADLSVSGRFDLYLAQDDGGSATMVVQGSAGVVISSVGISPDGAKIAFTSDAITNDVYDLYVVSSSGGTPFRVNPDRTSGVAQLESVFPPYTWSGDSRYLAFASDPNRDDVFQAFCADTTTRTRAVALIDLVEIPVQTDGEQGVRGALEIDSEDNVYFAARTVANDRRYQLFRAAPDGSLRTNITSLVPARSDATTPDVSAFGISADGKHLAIAADSPTAGLYDLHTAMIGSSSTDRITDLTNPWSPNRDYSLTFSPDGTQIAAIGTLGTIFEPFMIAADGTEMLRLVDVAAACGGCATPNAQQLSFTADGTSVYVVGDLTDNDRAKAYRLDRTMADQVPVLAVDVPMLGEIFFTIVRPL